MQVKTIIETLREKYVFHSIEKENSYCMGTKKDCWSPIDKGWKSTPYGRMESLNIRKMRIIPTLKNIESATDIDFLTEHIEYLWLPLPLAKYLSSNKKISQIQNLIIENKESYLDIKKLFDNFEFNNTSFNHNLKSLIFIGDSIKSGKYWHKLKFNIEQFSNIEYLSTILDSEEGIIENISKLNTLKHLDIHQISSAKILDCVNELKLNSISFSGVSADVNFEQLETKNTIEAIRINNSKKITIDCNTFRKFPFIKEVSLLGVNKILNPHVFLELPNLRNLVIINCSNPIKKIKNELLSHNFDILDIDFA